MVLTFWSLCILVPCAGVNATLEHHEEGLQPIRIPRSGGGPAQIQPALRPIPQVILSTTTSTQPPDPNEDPAVTRFRQFLRFDTSHPNPNYASSMEKVVRRGNTYYQMVPILNASKIVISADSQTYIKNPAVDWLEKQANDIGLEFKKINFPPPGLFAVIMTWRGSNASLSSIMLNSHIDVVPADKSKWKHDPFAAFKEQYGDIYARGAQDRKSLGVQYLEAVRGLKAKRFRPLRTIHITYLPDEELGGFRGMQPFVNSTTFRALNVGMVMDEGGATPGPDYYYALYYGERVPWQFKVIATGRPSHAALMFRDNAAVKLEKVISRLLKFREKQLNLLESNQNLTEGDVTSINLSQLGGGLQPNVVPSEMWAIFDMRIRVSVPDWTFSNVTTMLDDICTEAGPGVRYEFILKSQINGETVLNDQNIWWTTFKNIFETWNYTLTPKIFPGATDARFIRNMNITALGFAPLPLTEPLQHQDNEFLNEYTFLDGISIYRTIISKLSSIPYQSNTN